MEIDTKILLSEKALKTIESADVIAKHSSFVPVVLPTLPHDFEHLISKGLSEVSVDAAERVRQQIELHGFKANGEAWLAEGLKHIANDSCPFCSASVEGNQLIEAYAGYFSQSYADHTAALADLGLRLKDSLSEAAAMKVVQGFELAGRTAEYWQNHLELPYLTPEGISEIFNLLKELFRAASERLDDKLASPLEVRPAAEAYTVALQNWLNCCDKLDAANIVMTECNASIKILKETHGNSSLKSAELALVKLRAIKQRNTEPFLGLAKNYLSLIEQKAKHVNDKGTKKLELDAYDAKLFGAYEAEINSILQRFNAGFRLTKCGKNYVGKTPQSEYCLQFDGNDVDVSKPDGLEPSFDSTMSAGDKSTFALAFFLAQLNRDEYLFKKVVVFDDPFTSLDDFRRELTAKSIVRVGEKASQVIVFSHDKHFLEAIRQKIHGETYVTMQISGAIGNSALSPWDIEREVKEGYLSDHMTIVEYTSGTNADPKPIRTMLRPLLEKYIRYRFPNQISDGHWLGDMLKIIRDDVNHPLQLQYQDISDINEYTAPFHHDPNTNFNSDEVMAYAKLTLKIVGGC